MHSKGSCETIGRLFKLTLSMCSISVHTVLFYIAPTSDKGLLYAFLDLTMREGDFALFFKDTFLGYFMVFSLKWVLIGNIGTSRTWYIQ